MSAIKAWHFCRQDKRLAYGDGREIVVGETLSVDGHIQLCEHGLHGSVNVLDALSYAPCTMLCSVEIWGDVIEGGDKIAGRNRKTLAMADVADTLLLFARRTALSVANLWDCPPKVRHFLETGESAAWASSAERAARAARAAERAAERAERAAWAALASSAARAAWAALASSAARAAWASLAERAAWAALASSAARAAQAEVLAPRAERAAHNEMLLDLLKTRHPELFLGEITQ